MPPPNPTFAQIHAIVDELARCGLRHAVTSPGSRNAPISLTLAADDRIDTVSVIDERSAGFVALGMAKASGRPVAVTCTSGTAVANLLPAVVEAHEARVPLILLTADRPPELRDVGAGQAIDQLKIFGSAAKWFVELGNGEPGRDWTRHLRALACRVWWTAAGGPAGPVHVNVPLREPLAPVPADVDPSVWAGRPDGRPWVGLREHARVAETDEVEALAERVAAAERGVLICGGGAPGVAQRAVGLATSAGWPLFAEPTSGLRSGRHAPHHVISHYDPLLQNEPFAGSHRPDLVLRIGEMPTSKALRRWVVEAPQVVIDPDATWNEPTRTAESIVQADPGRLCADLSKALAGRTGRSDPDWLEEWRLASIQVPLALLELDALTEPSLYPALRDALPENAVVWLSSSMPVRYAEAFFNHTDKPVRFFANRGANGIDGVVSSAAGAARATGAPTFLVIGDVALAHDIGGLLAARRAGIDLTVICVDNHGGAIFDLLPLAEHSSPDAYEEHIATATGLDLGAVAELAGLEHRLPTTTAELHRTLSAGPGLIEIRIDRREVAGQLRGIHAAIARRLAELGQPTA